MIRVRGKSGLFHEFFYLQEEREKERGVVIEVTNEVDESFAYSLYAKLYDTNINTFSYQVKVVGKSIRSSVKDFFKKHRYEFIKSENPEKTAKELIYKLANKSYL